MQYIHRELNQLIEEDVLNTVYILDGVSTIRIWTTSVCLSGELAYGFVDAARHRVVDAEGNYRPDGRVCVGVEIWSVCRQ